LINVGEGRVLVHKRISYYFLIVILLGCVKIACDEVIFRKRGENKYYKNYFYCLRGVYDYYTGNTLSARKFLEKIVTSDKGFYLYDSYLRILFDSGNFSKVVEIVDDNQKDVISLINNNVDLHLLIAQSYLHAGHVEKAFHFFNELEEKYPDNHQVSYFIAVSLLKKGDINGALNFIKRKVKRKRNRHFLLYFLQAKIYAMLGKADKALSSVEKSLSQHSLFDKAWLFKASLLEQAGCIENAIKSYEKYLEIVGNDDSVEKTLVQLFFEKKEFAKAEKYLLKVKNDSSEYFFDLAMLNFKSRNFDKASMYVNESLKKNSLFQRARQLKFEILLESNKIEQLLTFLQQCIIEQPNVPFYLHSLLSLQEKEIPEKKIIKVLETVIQSTKSFLVCAVLADMYVESKEYEKSLELYKKAFELNNKKELKSRFLFQIAYVYSLQNNMEKMLDYLHKSLNDCDPVHPSSYNLLAYYYTKTNKKLEQSLVMINKAIETCPSCAYYLDTKGILLMKMGDVKNALEVLKLAHAQDPYDPIIEKHLEKAYEYFEKKQKR
jgi:tetratricopeptide (TPR) repeat protein